MLRNVSLLNTTELCTDKNGEGGKFYVCFATIKHDFLTHLKMRLKASSGVT